MIGYNFPDPAPSMYEVCTIGVPFDEDFDDSWIYNRYEVVVRFICADGCLFVVVEKDY